MKTVTTLPHGAISATRVPEDEQPDVLARHFGGNLLAVRDAALGFMLLTVREYRMGPWHYYELSNGGFYMAPGGGPVQLRIQVNGYKGEMTADAAGITACLDTLSQLAHELKNDVMIRHYFLLRDFALQHAERKAIFAAID